MKKLFFVGVFLLSVLGYGQILSPFEVRKQESVKGGLRLIGNNILNVRPTASPYHGTAANDRLRMDYIDVDNDDNTFSSSAASLDLSGGSCSKIRYAGLYWGGTLSERNTAKNTIQFKSPSMNSYTELTADAFLYDYETYSISLPAYQYLCYKDVTHLLENQQASGEYWVANVRASNSDAFISGGVSAGWLLVIIYENPNETAKNITTFDGFASIEGRSYNGGLGTHLDIVFSGFRTLPSPLPVKARIGVAALEGDQSISGDRLYIKKPNGQFTELSDAVNPANNFFNSSISYDGAILTDRKPNSSNTLGWDIDLFSIPNGGNAIIENDQTSVAVRARTTQDKFDLFFAAIEVEVIEPKIEILKTAERADGTLLSGQSILPGTTIYYGLEFENTGNDNATNLTMTDVLPKNVSLDVASLEIPLQSGITHQMTTNNKGETILHFDIPDALVAVGQGKHKIRFAVALSSNCQDFSEPCSEMVTNEAFASYKGLLNQSVEGYNGSFSATDECNIGIAEATRVWVDLSGCATFSQNHTMLCGENLNLVAGSGFEQYQWKNQQGEIIGNTQTISIEQGGVYSVTKTKQGCTQRTEMHLVDAQQRQAENPAEPFAGVVFNCPTSGRSFPQIFLCGENAQLSMDLQLIGNLQSVLLERYNGTSSVALNSACPPKTVQWQSVSQQTQLTIAQEGIYKLLLLFENGCQADYYFRVHTSPISPTVTTMPVGCNTIGSIQIDNVPSGYEYALRKSTDTNALIFQPLGLFQISEVGVYSVFVRKTERLPEDCTIEIQNIRIDENELKISHLQKQNESCYQQNDGSISLEIVGTAPPYSVILVNSEGQNVLTKSGVGNQESILLPQLVPSAYTLEVIDRYSCSVSEKISIEKAVDLSFRTESRVQCVNNVPTGQVVVSVSNPQVNLSQVQYAIGNAPQRYSPVLENGQIIIPESAIPNVKPLTLTLFYNGCSQSASVALERPSPIVVSQVIDPSLISAIKVSASGGVGNYSYFFNNVQQANSVYYLQASDQGYVNSLGYEMKRVTVRIEDSSGCYAERIIEEPFFEVNIPQYFTPNNDGINDTWKIGNALGYPHMQVHIFDRFGRLITILNSQNSWNGKYNNANMPTGDYWFELKFNSIQDKRIFVGHFTLYR